MSAVSLSYAKSWPLSSGSHAPNAASESASFAGRGSNAVVSELDTATHSGTSRLGRLAFESPLLLDCLLPSISRRNISFSKTQRGAVSHSTRATCDPCDGLGLLWTPMQCPYILYCRGQGVPSAWSTTRFSSCTITFVAQSLKRTILFVSQLMVLKLPLGIIGDSRPSSKAQLPC